MAWSVRRVPPAAREEVRRTSASRQGCGGQPPRSRAVRLRASPPVPTSLALGRVAKLSRTQVYQSAGLGWATVTSSPRSQWLNATKAVPCSCYLSVLCGRWWDSVVLTSQEPS